MELYQEESPKRKYYKTLPKEQRTDGKGSNSPTHPFNRQNRNLPTMRKLRQKKQEKY